MAGCGRGRERTRAPRAWLPALALALTAAGPALAGSLQQRLAGYRQAAPAPAGIPADGITLESGRMTLTLSGGRLLPLRTPDGEMLGLFFAGEGAYRYRVEDRADRLVTPGNLRRHGLARLAAEPGESPDNSGAGELVLGDAFTSLLLVRSHPLAGEPPVLAADPAGAVEVDDAAREQGRRMGHDLERTALALDHLLAEALVNGAGEVAYVEVQGALARVAHLRQTVREPAEGLYVFSAPAGDGSREMISLSRQLLAPGPGLPPALLVVEDLRLDLATADNRTGSIATDLKIRAEGRDVALLPLALVNNRDREARSWDAPAHRLHLRRVLDDQRRELAFDHRHHEVLVELAEPLRAGDSVRLHLETDGEIFVNEWGVRRDDFFSFFQDAWYPRPVGWASGRHLFSLGVDTAQPFVPMSSGRRVAFREADGRFHLEAGGEVTAGLIAVIGGRYKSREERLGSGTLRLHGYGMADQNVLTKMGNLARRIVAFYEKNLGAMPFRELDVVEIPDYGFGVAPSGLVLMTSEAYKPRMNILSTATSQGVNARLAHELAHQWFGHGAYPASPRDIWLAESLSEYMAGLALAALAPEEPQIVGFSSLLQIWRDDARHYPDAGSLEGATLVTGEGADRRRTSILYSRGPLVLHMLRTLAGDVRFFAILRALLRRGESGPVGTADFQAAVEEVLGREMGWFVDQWAREAGVPTVRVDRRLAAGGDGVTLLTGSIEQEAGPGFKRMIIPLVITYPDGSRSVQLVEQDRPRAEYRIELPDKPRRVQVDPARNNLAIYRRR